ncbi:MAG: hypothetical protein KAS32_11425 [Candidatus Peribacteraceae bacterium]|nr:hypothetical protein [Candidatus Peribacteraceae bacterium]
MEKMLLKLFGERHFWAYAAIISLLVFVLILLVVSPVVAGIIPALLLVATAFMVFI